MLALCLYFSLKDFPFKQNNELFVSYRVGFWHLIWMQLQKSSRLDFNVHTERYWSSTIQWLFPIQRATVKQNELNWTKNYCWNHLNLTHDYFSEVESRLNRKMAFIESWMSTLFIFLCGKSRNQPSIRTISRKINSFENKFHWNFDWHLLTIRLEMFLAIVNDFIRMFSVNFWSIIMLEFHFFRTLDKWMA